MHKPGSDNNQLPSARKIKRTCKKELYRTIKKLNIWIPPEQIIQAEKLYYQKVILNLVWISEHWNQRKKQADWWEENCCTEIAELWGVEPQQLANAFRESFGG